MPRAEWRSVNGLVKRGHWHTMCGIVGLIQAERPVDAGVLGRMTTALAHRGPDHQETKRLSAGSIQVGLGHTRLSIIDLSGAAAQPMGNDDGSIWIVFNGEIYNFRELRQSLERRGIRFRTSSDTEVILRLYEAEQDRCVGQLDGMFALAIWDSRQRRLLVARDRVGKKPLFYSSTPGLFAFASEMKALFHHPALAPDVDREAIPAFFLYGYVPNPRTFYRGIQQLPPGHLLEVRSDGQVRLERYWDLDCSTRSGPLPKPGEAAAHVRELVTASVRRRLVADVPLGAFLSGGLDSSIIVGIMSRLKSDPIRTFSIGFTGDARYDETAYARLVSKRFGTVHTEFVVEPPSVDQLIERLVWHHDGPFADEAAVPTYILSRLTREHVTVALNGDGGDELFAGYLRFYGTLASERLPVPMRRAMQRVASWLPGSGAYRSRWRRVKTFADGAVLPFAERFTRWASVFYEDLPQLLDGRGAPGLPLDALALLEPHLSRCAGASPLNRLLYLNLKTCFLDGMLVKTDRCSMAHGLETRSPFVDRELMEYVFTLPDHFKLRGGRTKVILRQAFADLLPPTVARRSKMGFTVPLASWFRRELRDYLKDLLLSSEAKLRGYLNQDYVRQLYDAHLAGQADHATRLWTVLTFEVWLRTLPQWTNGAPVLPMPVPSQKPAAFTT